MTFYFLAKSYLFFSGYLRFDALLNLFLLAFILLPLPQGLRKHRPTRIFQKTVNIILAFLLFWHDSWFPPLTRAFDFITDPTTAPTPQYVLSFLARYLDPVSVLIMATILVGSQLAQRSGRVKTVVLLATVSIAAVTSIGHARVPVAEKIANFYTTESKRTVSFDVPSLDSSNFDIILLHVCSLSWADLEAAGLRDHPFLKQFDILFTQFNGVTSYSGMAAYRLLRSACGQTSHGKLFSPARKECYLLDRLRSLGFRTYTAMDHDGKYADFAATGKKHGHMDPPLPVSGIPIRQYNFDGSPIYDGYATLDRWWKKRLRDESQKSVLYYNTITLHEGTKWEGDERSEDLDEIAKFKISTVRFFESLQQFFNVLSSSGRNVVVVFVPEHGRALQGSVIQAPGLREIPLPDITHIPVGVKFFGAGLEVHEQQRTIETPTSYQALAWLLAELIEQPPFDSTNRNLDLSGRPSTNFLSENEGVQVADFDCFLYVYEKQKKWMRLPDQMLRRKCPDP